MEPDKNKKGFIMSAKEVTQIHTSMTRLKTDTQESLAAIRAEVASACEEIAEIGKLVKELTKVTIMTTELNNDRLEKALNNIGEQIANMVTAKISEQIANMFIANTTAEPETLEKISIPEEAKAEVEAEPEAQEFENHVLQEIREKYALSLWAVKK